MTLPDDGDYEHTMSCRGERFPRRAASSDPADRDVRDQSVAAGAAPRLRAPRTAPTK